jgi:predicted nucleotidyltransferase
MARQPVSEAIRRYIGVLNENGIPVSFAVLYGSNANGTAREDSDIDLVVVSSYFDSHRERQAVSSLWRLTVLADSRIEPVACGLKEWEEDDSRPILEIAKREGVRVHV